MFIRTFDKSRKLDQVCYDIRGPVLKQAKRMEEEGHKITKLNIGNPAPFGFEAPEDILKDVIHNLPSSQGYCDAKGIYSARVAVMQYYQQKGLAGLDIEDVYIGNGVSELIVMAMQALINPGDEILIPSPDYPLWTAAVTLSGGNAVHYRCQSESDWFPDIEDIENKITANTKALLLINPNNPTGAVYDEACLKKLVAVAEKHQLILLSDEIYDKILYDGVNHVSTATLTNEVVCLTFGGLSKNYRVAGFRAGWLLVSGAKYKAEGYLEGLEMLASMRLCANVPCQHAIQTALGGYQSIEELIVPTGRLRQQRDLAWEMINQIPGVSCIKPQGAMYLFFKLDQERFNINDDERLILDLLKQQKLLLVQGTAFNFPAPDHIRLVFLPHKEELESAISRLATFLGSYRQ